MVFWASAFGRKLAGKYMDKQSAPELTTGLSSCFRFHKNNSNLSSLLRVKIFSTSHKMWHYLMLRQWRLVPDAAATFAFNPSWPLCLHPSWRDHLCEWKPTSVSITIYYQLSFPWRNRGKAKQFQLHWTCYRDFQKLEWLLLYCINGIPLPAYKSPVLLYLSFQHWLSSLPAEMKTEK